MAVLPFHDLYIGECEKCGADLEGWTWLEDELVFSTVCTCGTDYTLEPTAGTIVSDPVCFDDEDDESED